MCPVIATRNGAPWLAIGASGGRRIMPAVLQIASMLIDGGLDLERAFHLPRIDVSGGPAVVADRRLAPDIVAALETRFAVAGGRGDGLAEAVRLPERDRARAAHGEVLGMTDPMQPVAGAAAA